MAKYTFSKPYSTTISLGGSYRNVRTHSWKAGDVIDAEPFTDKELQILASQGARIIPSVKYLANPHPMQGGQMFAYIPLDVLTVGANVNTGSVNNQPPKTEIPPVESSNSGSDNKTKKPQLGLINNTGNSGNVIKEQPTLLTPKNIIIGVLVIGAVIGLLKWKKVI